MMMSNSVTYCNYETKLLKLKANYNKLSKGYKEIVL